MRPYRPAGTVTGRELRQRGGEVTVMAIHQGSDVARGAYGLNNLHTGFEFYVLRVTPNGLEQTEHRDVMNGFSNDITYADGFVYGTPGEVVDVRNPAAPAPAGKFSYSGLVLPLAGDRVLMLTPKSGFSSGPSKTTLRLLDRKTFTQTKMQTLDSINEESMADLIQTGTDTVAFIGRADRFGSTPSLNRIYVVRTSLLR